MEGHLKFNLPEDEDSFRVCQDGWKWRVIANDLDQFLRTKLKHGHEFESADAALSATRQKLHDLIEEYEVKVC